MAGGGVLMTKAAAPEPETVTRNAALALHNDQQLHTRLQRDREKETHLRASCVLPLFPMKIDAVIGAPGFVLNSVALLQ